MGYLAPASSSTGSGTKSYLSGLAPPAPAPSQSPEGPTPLGFLGNVVSGLGSLAGAVGQLGGGLLKDLAIAPIEAVTLGKADIFGGFSTPHALSTLIGLGPTGFHPMSSPLVKDFEQRYGALAPGGRPASEFFQELYDKPVSFALDALTVASAGGAAAAKVGGAAVAADAGASAIAGGVEGALKAVGVAGRTAKAASISSGLDYLKGGITSTTAEGVARTLGPQSLGRAASALQPLLPDLTASRVGDTLVAASQFRNPLTRLALDKTLGYALRSPLKDIQSTIGKAAGVLGEPVAIDAAANRLAIEQGIAAQAEALGLKRLPNLSTDTVGALQRGLEANLRASQTFKGIRNATSGAWFQERNQAIKTATQPWRDAFKLNPEAKTSSSAVAMGLHNLPVGEGVNIDATIMDRITRELGGTGALRSLDLNAPAVAAFTVGDIAPASIAALRDHPYLVSAQVALQHLNEFKQMVTENTDALTTAGWDTTQLLDGADRLISHTVGDINYQAANLGNRDPIVLNEIAKTQSRASDIAAMAEGWKDPNAIAFPPHMMVDEMNRPLQVMAGSSTKRGIEALAPKAQAAMDAVEQWTARRAAQLQKQTTESVNKVGSWFDRRASALFNKQSFDQPLGITDAYKLAAQELADGAAPRAVLDAVGVARENAPQALTAGGASQMAFDALAAQPTRALSTLEHISRLEDQYIPASALDDALRANGLQPPIYYPHIDATRLSNTDYFRANVLNAGALRRAADPNLKYNTESLLRSGTYIRDPIDAFGRRAARSVRMAGTMRSIEALVNSPLARPITKPGDLASGERIIAPDLSRILGKASHDFMDIRDSLLMAGEDPAAANLAALEKMMASHQDEMMKLIESDGIKMYAVPDIVARRINDTARAAQFVNGRWAKIYVDGPMNVWRSMVLAGSPRWIVNNVIGNTIFGVMQGAPITRALHVLEGRWAKMLEDSRGWKLDWVPGVKGGKALDEALASKLDELGISSSVDIGFNRVEETTPPPMVPEPGQSFGAKIFQKSRSGGYQFMNKAHSIATRVRDLNSDIESAFRENSALTAIERAQGITRVRSVMRHFMRTQDYMAKINVDGWTEAGARDVLNTVNHFYGDFTNLGPWERHVVRRLVFPFWGFTKFQAKLFLSFPFEYPLRTQVLAGLADVTNQLQQQYGPVPEWLRNAVPLGPPGMTGATPFLTTSGPNPFNATFQNPLSSLSPLIKAPLELLTGRNAYTGNQFSAENVVTPFGGSPQRIQFDAQGNPIGAVPAGTVAPSPWNYLLNQIPQYDLLQQLIAGGKTYDTAGMAQAIEGRLTGGDTGVIRHGGETAYPSSIGSVLARFFGFPTTSYDLNKYQETLTSDQQAAVKSYLTQQGAP